MAYQGKPSVDADCVGFSTNFCRFPDAIETHVGAIFSSLWPFKAFVISMVCGSRTWPTKLVYPDLVTLRVLPDLHVQRLDFALHLGEEKVPNPFACYFFSADSL